MASINFKNLSVSPNKPRTYIWADLHLDITQKQIQHPGLTDPTIGKDIVLDYDLAAILNSLNNLFNTLPGQRILLPEFGLNLLQYLFNPVSEENGEVIGNNILNSIIKWEPRVTVQKILVNAIPDENEYDIGLALYVPTFKTYTGLSGKLASNGFAPMNTTTF